VQSLCGSRVVGRAVSARARPRDAHGDRGARRRGDRAARRRRAERRPGRASVVDGKRRAANPARGRRPGSSRGAPECVRRRDDHVRQRHARRARRGRGACRYARCADRSRVARQAVHRIRQPLRRRHDRADRLQLGLSRDDVVRHLVAARLRLSLPSFLSRSRENHSGGLERLTARPPCAARARARGHGERDRRRDAAKAATQNGSRFHRQRAQALRVGPQGSGRSGDAGGARAADPSAVSGEDDRRSRQRRRDLYRRRRHARIWTIWRRRRGQGGRSIRSIWRR